MPEFHDKRGLRLTMANQAAAPAHDHLVDGYIGFRQDTGPRLKAAMQADPEAPMNQCMAGYIFHLMVVGPLLERAAAASSKATALAESHGNAREKLHAAALAAWTDGEIGEAARLLELVLLQWPLDIAALKLVHYLHFYLGNIAEHRDSVARVMPAWTDDTPGFANVLGMRAFGLEEAGHYAEAERIGRRAVELDPTDAWSVHAVAHVLEMQGRAREGIHWIEREEANWAGKVHNFANHVWWHKALYHLELGEHDAVLDLYDNAFRAEETDDGLDIANAAAMLTRLKIRGVECGPRWDRLADVAATKADEHILPFNDLHIMLALSGAGQDAKAVASCSSIASHGGATGGTWGPVYSHIARPMADGIAAYGAGDYASAAAKLSSVRYKWSAIGGSHAQRDVFQQILIDATIRSGDTRQAKALLAERTGLRSRSAFDWERLSDAASATGDKSTAARASANAQRLRAD